MSTDRRDDEARRWGSLLAQRRAEARLTHEALATMCGVSHAALRRWERGECVPSDERWPALEKALPGLPRPSRSEPVPAAAQTSEDAPSAQPAEDAPVAPPRVATPVVEEQAPPPAPPPPPSYEELAAQVEQLQQLATIDPLTQVRNRRAMEAARLEALDAAHRRGEPLAVALIDIDHFKKINDTFGHPAADGVLKAVAARLGGSLRKNDSFGRWGGEEFLAVFEDVQPQRARVLAERMRGLVQELNAEGIACTISIGVATYSPPRRRLKDDSEALQLAELLTERADKALYWAKQGGRNRVELWSKDAEEQRAAAAKRAELAQAATAMLAAPQQPRWSLRRAGLAAAAIGLFLSSASLGGEGGCGGGPPVTCGPGTCNDGGKCIPCGGPNDPTIDPGG
ncbi:MAG: diguanylate cyclase [Polyangia bacterium]